MNDNYYLGLFKDIFNIRSKSDVLISTIDHPYSSPPIRLFDSYLSLSKLAKNYEVIPFIWDISIPLNQTKRYDLIFDNGLIYLPDISTIFKEDIPIYRQSPQKPCFDEIKMEFTNLIHTIDKAGLLCKALDPNKIIGNLEILIAAYSNVFKTDNLNSFEYYTRLQIQLSNLIGIQEQVHLLMNNSVSVATSQNLKTYISQLLNKNKHTDLNPFTLGSKVFFKSFINSTQPYSEPQSIDELIDMVLNDKDIFYSYELVFWALSLSNIYHYGNSYSFFDRLQEVTEIHASELQLTQHNQDGQAICGFKEDESFILKNSRYKIKHDKTKTSRINTFNAIYIRLGDDLKNIFSSYITNPNDYTKVEISYLEQ